MKPSIAVVLSTLLMLVACDRRENATFHASVIVEGTAIKVAAQTGGYLQQMLADEGDELTAGQTIAVVDTEKLSYQLEQVLANLEDLRAQHRIAATNVRRAQEDHEHARVKHERYLELFHNNAASQQLLDDLKIALDRAAAALESARQNLHSLASRIKALEAQTKLLRRQIQDATVKAPVNGTLTTRYYDPGETVPTNAPLVEIIDLSKMWAKVYVSELYLPRLRLGQPAQVKIDGTGQTLVGTVAWISAKAEFTPKNILTEESRTSLVYAVKINIDNPGRVLKHGMPVAITLSPAS